MIANGIDVDCFKPDPSARAVMRKDLGLSDAAFLLAHVARVDPMKDHATFLKALIELPNVYALLVGAGTERLAGGLNILTLGRREDVPQLLAAADAVVSSSAFGEGFSNVLAEGMACGLPPVTTDVGDARTIVGDSGLIVPPRDPRALAAAIRVLAEEPQETRADRGARARRHIVANFSMAQAMQRYSELYGSFSYPRS
jgi:glycosyltransferase involved in cell wall biosynthesis